MSATAQRLEGLEKYLRKILSKPKLWSSASATKVELSSVLFHGDVTSCSHQRLHLKDLQSKAKTAGIVFPVAAPPPEARTKTPTSVDVRSKTPTSTDIRAKTPTTRPGRATA